MFLFLLSVVTETITSRTILTSLPPSECPPPPPLPDMLTRELLSLKLNTKYNNYSYHYSPEGSARWVRASPCFAVCLLVARGNQRIKSQEYVQRCWRAGLGEECLNPEQQWNVFLLMWEQISTRGPKLGSCGFWFRPVLRCWTQNWNFSTRFQFA